MEGATAGSQWEVTSVSARRAYSRPLEEQIAGGAIAGVRGKAVCVWIARKKEMLLPGS